MISIWVVIGMILLHLVGDFFFQNDWMALNKGKDWKALLTHTGGVFSMFPSRLWAHIRSSNFSVTYHN